jgi:hypothetical protein
VAGCCEDGVGPLGGECSKGLRVSPSQVGLSFVALCGHFTGESNVLIVSDERHGR